MTADQIINLLDKIIWPMLLVIIILINLRELKGLLKIILTRIDEGAPFQISSYFQLGSVPSNIKSPNEGESVSEENIVLLHSSWRYPKMDKLYGEKMYGIQVIIQANKDVLDKIEYVKYILDPSYPQEHQLQTRTNRNDKFELKELAYGEFIIKADVKIRNQNKIVRITRYLNLTEKGVNLLERKD